MLMDRYGLGLSTGAPEARDAYVEGSDLLLTFYPGAVESFDRAIAANPCFALGIVHGRLSTPPRERHELLNIRQFETVGQDKVAGSVRTEECSARGVSFPDT